MESPQFAYLEYATTYQKPFITYRLPNEKESITLIIKENSAKEIIDYTNISEKSGFIFTPFDTKNNASFFIVPEEILKGDKGFRGDLFLDKNKGNVRQNALQKNNETQAAYKSQFEQMHILLKQNSLQKIILSRTLTLENFPKEEQIYTYYNLINQYPQAMVYWVHLPHLGVEWMGATPELLVAKSDNYIETLALAGTKKADENWTVKEREEQQMVVDYISEQLKDFQPIVSETETLDTGAVQHLATHFKIHTTSNLFPIIEKLHPTPAICGLPQQSAFEAIRKIETHSREYYCGFLGPININNTTATFVNLRCMQLANHQVRLYMGGGLTKDSNLDREWQETERKADTLRRFLI